MTTDNGIAGPVLPAEPSGAAEPRCAHCAALLAPGIVWCAQCYAPIVAPEPLAALSTEVPETDVAADVAADGAADGARDVAHDTDPPERGPLVADALDPKIAVRADEMLALLANPATSGSRSGGGFFRSVTDLMSNTGARIAVIGAGTVLLTMVGFGLLSLLGQML
jgi:hypothetical protein